MFAALFVHVPVRLPKVRFPQGGIMMSFIRWSVVVCLFSLTTLFAQDAPEGRLLRFPDISKDKIAFVYGGDIWLVASSGGVAHRITTYPGRELFPKFSPDGKWLAFTGQYDGNFNVYVMPAEGGQPKQLTFDQGGTPLSDRMGIHNEVVTWTPDSKRIVFLTRRDSFNGWTRRPYSISIEGGLPDAFPMDQGGLLSYSPDGTKIAYNTIFRNFRTWKRYTGGMAQDILIYDLKNNSVDRVPHTDYTDSFPMWSGNTIYFTSDRGPEHRLNLYSYDLGSKQVTQLTQMADYDVMWPSLGPGGIVFENAGYLYVYDFASKQAKKLTVQVPGERDQAMKRWASANKQITDFDVSPDGKRAVFGARGEVFTVPAKDGPTRNITHTTGIREQKVAWSPDGKWIAYVSDRTGEDEIYIQLQDGLGKEQPITSGYKGFKFAPAWSPDSKKIAWSDKDLAVWYVDISDKKPVLIERPTSVGAYHKDVYGEITDYAWSPDSKWISYSKPSENGNSILYLYSLASAKITPVTTNFYNSNLPVFDPEGKYLYFLSDRDYNEVLGNYDFEFANPKTTRVYAVTLRTADPSPFPPQSDETAIKEPAPANENPPAKKDEKKDEKKPNETATNDKEKDKEKDEKSKKDILKDFHIDLDGIAARVAAFPVPPSQIRTLAAGKGVVYYGSAPVQGLNGPIPGEESAIHAYDLKDRKDKVVIEGADRFTLSFDGSKILYQASGGTDKYGIIDAKPPDSPKKPGEGALKLDGMKAEVDPPAEWKNMFHEVWRQERDYFFETSMNGVDWDKVRQKYETLLPYVSSRYDLTYILGEMIGELSNSHTYVGGGDLPDVPTVKTGLLGADFELDAASGLYRIKKIYPGENWDPQLRSPLTEPGVNVKEGDYVLAINGRPLRAPQSPYELLANTANENVSLTVNAKPVDNGSHNVQVKTISDEYGLHNLAWVEGNRKKVEAATGGKVGYVYIPDMGAPGLNAFVKQFFPQIRKQGLIIDVRYNGGGFVDQLIFARLRRILVGMDTARNFEPGTVPPVVFNGAMACITNRMAASDGDIFSYFFKVYKLGPLIGERTWGGVRGIRGNFPLMDGGYITRPEFARYGMDSKWVVENRGVAPDIELENRPDLVVKGQDPQLERAIQEVMKQIQAKPPVLPQRPPDLPAYPDGPGM
jgi:tricorn protease